MINIYIKSFNRPYFLDRCLYSLDRYVTGKYQVIILDDGTPEKYVQRIQEKYPKVIFTYTDKAALKRKEIQAAIESGQDQFTRSIPISFWRKTVEAGSDIFFMTEDDIWIYEPIDVDEYVALMKEKSINQIKVRWNGNENTNIGVRKKLNEHIEAVIPRVHFMAESIVKNRFYIHSLLLKLKLIKSTFFLQLYTYYEVAGVFFDKKFWLYLYPENHLELEEMIQLGRAAEWARTHPDTMFAKSIKESAKTSCLTSAAGGYNEKSGFSMTMVNHYINEEWYHNRFDIMENFPHNYSLETFYEILKKCGDPRCDPDKWKKWSVDFKEHFMSFGAFPEGK